MEKSLWLKDIRLKLDLTQEQVAERAGISRTFYTEIETGSKKRRSTDPELPGGGWSAAALYDRNQSPSLGSRQHQPRNRNPGNG